jgi:CarD family transcriptional regulator
VRNKSGKNEKIILTNGYYRAKIISLLTNGLLYVIILMLNKIREASFMFEVGDKVVYPMHGAGIIESIEEREILGEKQSYYVLKFPVGDMKVMIPTTNVEQIGIREVVSDEEVDKVVEFLSNDQSHMSSNWNKRYRQNMEKIKSGDIYEVAEVVRNLMLRDREKGLSTAERKMLTNARQILISEIVLSKDADEAEVTALIDGIIDGESV